MKGLSGWLKGIKEYAVLVPSAMENWDKVIEGTINQVRKKWDILPIEYQEEIVRRRLICAICPFNSSNAVADGYTTYRVDEHCVMCGCSINRKTASLSAACGIDCCNASPTSKCNCKKEGLKEYNKKHNINMPIKWTAYKLKENEQAGSTD